MTRIAVLGLSLAIVLGSAAPCQTIDAFFPDNSNTGAGNVFPFNTGNYTTVNVYPAAGLLAAGIVPGQHLAGVAIGPIATVGAGTFSTATGRIFVGHAATTPTIANQWINNLAGPQPVWDTSVDGTLTFPFSGTTWAAMPFSPNCVFFWDGVRDIVVYFSISGTHTGGFTVATSPTNSYPRHGVTQLDPVPGTAQTTTGVLGPRMRFTFDFATLTPNWQTNTPESNFTVDGVQGNQYVATTVNKNADNVCLLGTSTIAWSSTTLAGSPYELGITAGPGVPANAGGFTTPGGQILNLNLADPFFTFLFGGTFPPFAPASFPFTVTAPFGATAQMVIGDGTVTDGYRLSQAVRLNVNLVPLGVAGPTGDDSFLTYTLGAGGLCLTGPNFPYYGSSYTQLSVTTNGRIMITGVPNATYTPSVAGALGAPSTMGIWCDLNPGVGGSVNITTPGPGLFRVDYAAVPYFATAINNTFGLQVNCVSGDMQIDGLGGVATYASAQQFMGVSPGTGATDPGATNFIALLATGTQPGPGGSGMIYSFGSNGSLTTGLTQIYFQPNGSNNYSFIVL